MTPTLSVAVTTMVTGNLVQLGLGSIVKSMSGGNVVEIDVKFK